MTYLLSPSAEDAEAIQATCDDYAAMMALLSALAAGQGPTANLVSLHEQAYALVREATDLPARMVTLGLRDFASRQQARSGAAGSAGVPLDARLYAIKSPTHLSLATVRGRRLVPYTVIGYRPGWGDHAEARLLLEEQGAFVLVGVSAEAGDGDVTRPEGLLSRVGRVIAGLAQGAVGALETGNPISLVEQSIREIETVTEEARADMGRLHAEEHRMRKKLAEIEEEIADLVGKIKIGLAAGRDDLVTPVIGVQLGLEAQQGALRTALTEIAARITDAGQALQAALSARQDATDRLAALKERRDAQSAPAGLSATDRNALRLGRALGSLGRATGMPMPPRNAAASQIEELARLQREEAIRERLAALKALRRKEGEEG